MDDSVFLRVFVADRKRQNCATGNSGFELNAEQFRKRNTVKRALNALSLCFREFPPR